MPLTLARKGFAGEPRTGATQPVVVRDSSRTTHDLIFSNAPIDPSFCCRLVDFNFQPAMEALMMAHRARGDMFYGTTVLGDLVWGGHLGPP